MGLPLIPVVAALNTGGHLVAHSAGGLIVYSSTAGGYVAGTYISTAALAAFLNGTVIAGTAAISGAAIWAYGTVGGVVTSIVGSAGIFGTTLGATGITAALMSWGILPSTPISHAIAIGVVLLGISTALVCGVVRSIALRRFRRKVLSASDKKELQFTDREAKLVERIIRNISEPHNCLWRKVMDFFGRKGSKGGGEQGGCSQSCTNK